MRGSKLLCVALMVLGVGRCQSIGAEDEAGAPAMRGVELAEW